MKVIETQYVQIFLSLSNMALQVIQQLQLGSLTFHSRLALLLDKVRSETLPYPRTNGSSSSLFGTNPQAPAVVHHYCKSSHESHENLQFVWPPEVEPLDHLPEEPPKNQPDTCSKWDEYRNSWSFQAFGICLTCGAGGLGSGIFIPASFAPQKDTMPWRPPWDGLEF